MESLTAPASTMAEINLALVRLLEAMRAQPPRSLTPETMASAISDIVRVGEWMRETPAPTTDGELLEEMARYRRLLSEIREALPDLHAHLLTERSRLQAERAHLERARAWTESLTGQVR